MDFAIRALSVYFDFSRLILRWSFQNVCYSFLFHYASKKNFGFLECSEVCCVPTAVGRSSWLPRLSSSYRQRTSGFVRCEDHRCPVANLLEIDHPVLWLCGLFLVRQLYFCISCLTISYSCQTVSVMRWRAAWVPSVSTPASSPPIPDQGNCPQTFGSWSLYHSKI